MKYMKKIMLIMLLVIIALASITKVTGWATSTDTHSHAIEEVDNKVSTVLELTAGATAASAAISLLPDDQCTPIADQLAELGKYFLVVLSALYLEKYLVTVTGYVTFTVLIPIACALGIAAVISGKKNITAIAAKILICGMVIYAVVPASVKISDLIYEKYETSIESTLDEAVAVSPENDENETVTKIADWIADKAETVAAYVSDLLSRFIEALAVMIVTSCLIPVLVLILCGWLIKMMFTPERVM